MRNRRARAKRVMRLGPAALVAAVALAAPASAGATVYCFPDLAAHPSCDQSPGTFQVTLNAAQSNPGDDTVRLGAGSFPIPANQGYNDATPTNGVEIIGAGPGVTEFTLTDTLGSVTAILFTADAASTMRDFSLVIPANADVPGDRGLNLFGSATTRNVRVTGPDATNAVGVIMQGQTVLDDSTVDLEVGNAQSNFAVRSSAGEPSVSDSRLVGDIGADQFGGGATLTLDRSTIVARSGLTMDNGAIVARSTVIDLGAVPGAVGVSAANFNNGSSAMDVTAEHLTIVGGGPGSIGVRAIGDSAVADDPNDTVDNGEQATVTLSNSVISGPDSALLVAADRGESALLSTSYSNYTAPAVEDDDISDDFATGSATLTEANKTTHPTPGFVNLAAGDFHLLPTSPLLDIGDPAAPAAGLLDLDGDARALPGLPACPGTAGRRDIGADEFAAATPLDCVLPDTTISGKGRFKTKKKRAKVKFTLGSTEAGSSFECSLDGAAFAPCSSPFTATAKRGKHTLLVRARDAGGNVDATPAGRSFKVTKKKAKRKK